MDFPRNQIEFEKRFSSELQCRQFLLDLRCNENWLCVKCEGREYWAQSRGRVTCKRCRHEVSSTSGTVFHGSRLPLMIWFRAAWWVTNQKQGVSALGLQRALGLGSYRSAWLMLQKLRSAMVRPGRDRLKGEVEVDEALIGGHEKGLMRLRKFIVVIAAEKNGSRIGRIRMKYVFESGAYELMRAVGEMVESGSLIETDGWHPYRQLPSHGYKHRRIITRTVTDVNTLLPRVHLISSLFKRWLKGTLHGRFEEKHLQRYLDEFVFRFNWRASQSRGLVFSRLLENSVALRAPQYSEITRDLEKPPYIVP